jgi:hypothetical protein
MVCEINDARSEHDKDIYFCEGMTAVDELEIVGNLYENPELLQTFNIEIPKEEI